MEILKDGLGNAYAIGANWQLVQGKREAARLRRGAALALTVFSDPSSVISLVSRDEFKELGSPKKLRSAMGVIAAVERDAIVFMTLADGKVWIGACRDSAPLPGYDWVLSEDEGRTKVAELFQQLPQFNIIGNTADASRSFEEILKRADAKVVARTLYAKPLSPVVVPAAVGMVVLLAVVGFLVFREVQAARAQAERELRAQQAALSQAQKIDQVIAQYNAELRRLVEVAKRDVATTAPAATQVEEWMAVLRSAPFMDNGFRLDRAACTPAQCELTWMALRFADLAEGPAGDVAVREDLRVVTRIPVPAVAAVERTREERIELANRLHGVAALAGVQSNLAPQLEPITVPTPPKPAVPPEQYGRFDAVQAVTIGSRAAISAQVPYAYIADVARLIGGSVTLSTFEATGITSGQGSPQVPVAKVGGHYVRLP